MRPIVLLAARADGISPRFVKDPHKQRRLVWGTRRPAPRPTPRCASRRTGHPADQFAAAAGEDGWTAGEACPLLLAPVGREPSDETVVWQYAPADRRAVASGGIAEAVGAGKSIQSQKGTEGCLTKPDRKAAVSSCGTRVGADGTLSRALGPATEQIVRWNPRRGIELWAVGS